MPGGWPGRASTAWPSGSSPRARWDDLVLPAGRGRLLREMTGHVRHRMTVYEDWGFGAQAPPAAAASAALFAGASGTGKTMAAEVLAKRAAASTSTGSTSQPVVSKYIGETEKNLRRLFDAAEDGGAILFFDEADALFGKRSEVKDSHDRYANIEVSYLLQRMEAYRGLAILATNLQGRPRRRVPAPPPLRRRLPVPGEAERRRSGGAIFPAEAPVAAHRRLGVSPSFTLAGGNIRNIALFAAFLGRRRRRPIGDGPHRRRGAATECAKLERPLTEPGCGSGCDARPRLVTTSSCWTASRPTTRSPATPRRVVAPAARGPTGRLLGRRRPGHDDGSPRP